MLSVSIMRRARPPSVCARLFSGVGFSALAVVPRRRRTTADNAAATTGATNFPRRRRNPNNPLQIPLQPIPPPPRRGPEATSTNCRIGRQTETQSKPKRNVPAPQPVAQDAPTPAQAALNAENDHNE